MQRLLTVCRLHKLAIEREAINTVECNVPLGPKGPLMMLAIPMSFPCTAVLLAWPSRVDETGANTT